jgi:hypothetical protein
MSYTDITYSVKPAVRHDGKKVWRVYENDNFVDEFISEERAWNFVYYYARSMR